MKQFLFAYEFSRQQIFSPWMRFRYLWTCQWASQNHLSGDIFLYILSELFLIILFFFVEDSPIDVVMNNSNLDESLSSSKHNTQSEIRQYEPIISSHCDNVSIVIQQPKNSSRQKNNKTIRKPYDKASMAAAVEAVVKDEITPGKAVEKYEVPLRTMFRHVAKRREELGLPPKRMTYKKIKKEHINPAAAYRSVSATFTNESSIADRRSINSAALLKKGKSRFEWNPVKLCYIKVY